MAYSVTPTLAVDLSNTVIVNTNSVGTGIPSSGPLGLQVFGSDGKRYVMGKATEAIAASTAAVVNADNFNAAPDELGTYLSPAFDLVSQDVAWFSKASV